MSYVADRPSILANLYLSYRELYPQQAMLTRVYRPEYIALSFKLKLRADVWAPVRALVYALAITLTLL